MRARVGLLAGLMCLAMAAPPPAQGAGLSGKSGVFKVVKPPSRGARQRLTIHPVTRGTPPGTQRRAARHGWFWMVASPDIAAAEEGRVVALADMAARRIGGGDAWRLTRRIAAEFGAEITVAARGAKVSEALLIAVIAAESAGKPRATSPKGAQGLAQLMPATAERFGVRDAYDPAQNLKGAARYLSLLLDQFSGDAVLALAAYNAGENAVLRNVGVPNYVETRDYVPIVLSYWHAARNQCAPPVSAPRAPCRFALS